MRGRTSLSISEVIQALEMRAPRGTAEDWDNVGLLVGDPAWKTSGAVVSIDLTAEAIREAKRRGYRLIVNHHPCFFPKGRGPDRWVPGQGKPAVDLAFEAVREGIAVFASHTNFDRCALEVVSAICDGLGAVPRGRLHEPSKRNLLKLVVFVPKTHVETVRDAICAAGAGQIGDYDSCSFGSGGEGTFRGGPGTQPFLGKPGQLERAAEVRLETVLPRGLERPVLDALFRSHPYEEVAYDLYALQQAPAEKGIVRGLGYGFWGEFRRPKPFSEVLKGVKSLFQSNGYLLAGTGHHVSPKTPDASELKIRKLAFAAGKGSDFVESAISNGCDLMITGEAGYHVALEASRRGMVVMELGHRESERFFLTTMRAWLEEAGVSSIELNLPTQTFYGNNNSARATRAKGKKK